MAFGASVAHGPIPDVQYNLNGYTTANGLFGVWNSLGTVLFAYGGHNVVLEIQVCFCIMVQMLSKSILYASSSYISVMSPVHAAAVTWQEPIYCLCSLFYCAALRAVPLILTPSRALHAYIQGYP